MDPSPGDAASSGPSPVTIVCVGMAGSGKTTFMQRLVSHLHTHADPTLADPRASMESPSPPYVVNLDPAVHRVPFTANIDIRDSVNYKEVMRQFRLGPNGGIMTSLNLFSTKVDQIVGLIEKRTAPPPAPREQSTVEFLAGKAKTRPQGEQAAPSRQVKHVLVDTPGQIEVFVWSASGEILLSSFATSMPTVIAYVIDTPRTTSTSTFMSNMLYACSILYKTKLPMLLVFNKTDVQSADFATEWMTDFEAFQRALRAEEEAGQFGGESSALGGGSGYMGSLLNSMSLVLDEFYKHLKIVGVSAVTGEGIGDFFRGVDEKRAEFERDYQPELERRRQEHEKAHSMFRETQLGHLMKDMSVSESKPQEAAEHTLPHEDAETVSDVDENEAAGGQDNGHVSLSQRYWQALQHNRPDEDLSFTKHIDEANIG